MEYDTAMAEVPHAARRLIRLFVSSTFRDMGAERDELAKRVFPELRKLCESRVVTWADVDLRWGIPDERAAEHGALPICLAEIEKCRPFFIGLLGERYGYVPEHVPAEVIERHPWLANHPGTSITELEIRCGVLNNPAGAPHAAFYFRSPAYLSTLDPSTRQQFEEGVRSADVAALGPGPAAARAEERRSRLASLKDSIRASGARVHENCPDPRALAELVLADLRETIDRLYPEGSGLDPLDAEAADHEAYAASRRHAYVGRQEYFDRLQRYGVDGGPPLVVLGESGAGKSALLANWVALHRERNPGDATIVHFVGASPYSADWKAMLARIMGELKRRLDLDLEVPTEATRLREVFPEFLHRAAARTRVVLVLDALNQLDDYDGAPDLAWLPDELPEGVRLVVSTLPGRPLDEIHARRFATLTVQPLEPAERERLIAGYLTLYAKALDSVSAGAVAAAGQTANPLFLRTLLAELRVHGDHASLRARIAHYLAAETIDDLYERVLERYEADYERDRPGLVRDAMSLLWAARRGLSEAELLEMLGSGGTPLPGAYWSPLYLAADEGLVSRSGLMTFSHPYLRKAIEDRYVPDRVHQREAHGRVAAYFDAQALGPRKVDELPWQLMRAESWSRLHELLTDTTFLPAAFHANEFDVQTCWSALERDSDFRMAAAYGTGLEGRSLPFAFAEAAGSLLYASGNLEAALAVQQALMREYAARGERRALFMAMADVANIFQLRGDFDAALGLYRQAGAICREVGTRRDLWVLLSNEGRVLSIRGAVDAAMRLFEEQEQICREEKDDRGLASALRNRARMLLEQGEDEEALELYREQERLCRRTGDLAERAISLSNQAGILRQADPEQACDLYSQSEQIARSLGDRRKLATALQGQARIWAFRGRNDRAESLLREAERLCRQVGDIEDLIDTLQSLADIFLVTERTDQALALLEEARDACRECGNRDGLQRCLGSIARIQERRGDSPGAMGCYEEQARLCRELKNWRGLQAALGDHGRLLEATGRHGQALDMYLEREKVCRSEGIKDGLERAVAARAEILRSRGETDAAMTMYREQHRLCVELGKHDELTHAVLRQAEILANKRHLEGALQLFKAHEARCRGRGDRTGLAACLNGRGLALMELGQLRDALAALEEATQLASVLGNAVLERYTSENLALVGERLREREGHDAGA